MAENACPTLHNLYSLRGAQVRDARNWANYLNAAADRFGAETDTLFASHHWPRWKTEGGNEIVEFLHSQADMYRFLHDQTLRMANHGHTMTEIAEELEQALPENLRQWHNRGYYGTANHDIKAVYQRYLGWFDGNAAHLHTLPPAAAGARYVAAMGGADEVVSKARDAFEYATGAEDYRWAAELLSHVVFAQPEHTAARELEADVLEQLGYQAESGPWRNFYLAEAQELRHRPELGGEPELGLGDRMSIITPEVIAAMPIAMVFDYFGIRLDGPNAASHPMTLVFTIRGGLRGDPRRITVRLRNGVQVYQPTAAPRTADASYRITRHGLNRLALDQVGVKDLLDSGDLTVVTGSLEPFDTLMRLMDTFKFAFALTLP